jgi:hypothetical protein
MPGILSIARIEEAVRRSAFATLWQRFSPCAEPFRCQSLEFARSPGHDFGAWLRLSHQRHLQAW